MMVRKSKAGQGRKEEPFSVVLPNFSHGSTGISGERTQDTNDPHQRCGKKKPAKC